MPALPYVAVTVWGVSHSVINVPMASVSVRALTSQVGMSQKEAAVPVSTILNVVGSVGCIAIPAATGAIINSHGIAVAGVCLAVLVAATGGLTLFLCYPLLVDGGGAASEPGGASKAGAPLKGGLTAAFLDLPTAEEEAVKSPGKRGSKGGPPPMTDEEADASIAAARALGHADSTLSFVAMMMMGKDYKRYNGPIQWVHPTGPYNGSNASIQAKNLEYKNKK